MSRFVFQVTAESPTSLLRKTFQLELLPKPVIRSQDMMYLFSGQLLFQP